MAIVYKMTFFVVHKFIVLAMHKITLPTMRIELTKAVTFFLMNIKPSRSRKTSKNITVYRVAIVIKLLELPLQR